MKKLLIILLVVCVVFAGVIGYLQRDRLAADTDAGEIPAAEASAEPAADEAASPEPVVVRTLDIDRLYALHEPDEIVMTIDGADISWGEYYYWLGYYSNQVTSYFANMANYYGVSMSWDEPMGEDSEDTYADYVTAMSDNMLLQLLAVPGLAREDGIANDQAAIAEQVKEFRTALAGEEATDEEYLAKLAEQRMPESLVERLATQTWAFKADFADRYGENGEKISDEQAVKFLEDNGYISATHILLATVDLSTGEALEPDTVAEKKATAEKIRAELNAITDNEARLARFNELKDEYCEDTGKINNPDGYVFTAGTMTQSFEDAAFALEPYGLSEIIESEYGYHIILRLPNDADRTVEYSSNGQPRSARAMAADLAYGDDVSAYIAKLSPVYAEGYETPDLLEFIKDITE